MVLGWCWMLMLLLRCYVGGFCGCVFVWLTRHAIKLEHTNFTVRMSCWMFLRTYKYTFMYRMRKRSIMCRSVGRWWCTLYTHTHQGLLRSGCTSKLEYRECEKVWCVRDEKVTGSRHHRATGPQYIDAHRHQQGLEDRLERVRC